MRRSRAVTCGLSLLLAPLAAHAQEEPTFVVEERGIVVGARVLAATSSDPNHRRALMFGGYTNGGVRNDTLEWVAAAGCGACPRWCHRHATAPP